MKMLIAALISAVSMNAFAEESAKVVLECNPKGEGARFQIVLDYIIKGDKLTMSGENYVVSELVMSEAGIHESSQDEVKHLKVNGFIREATVYQAASNKYFTFKLKFSEGYTMARIQSITDSSGFDSSKSYNPASLVCKTTSLQYK
ncbi:MAG: hypothetical protein AAGB31_07780 [Bdellovibrio sp.]